MKKSHRVAHEKSEAWWVLLILLYNFLSYCQDFFCKKSVKKSTTPLCSLWYLFVIHSIIVTDSAFSFDLWYRQCAKRKQPMKSRSKSLCCCFRSAYVSVRIVQLPKRGLDLSLHLPASSSSFSWNVFPSLVFYIFLYFLTSSYALYCCIVDKIYFLISYFVPLRDL